MLATPACELGALVEQLDREHPGAVRDLAPGELDVAEVAEQAERARAEADGEPYDPDPPPFVFLSESPLPSHADTPDVWVFGNPPQARANRAAIPRFGLATEAPDAVRAARWLARALHQRARTYERVVGILVERRPQLAIATSLDDIEPVTPREIAEAVGMHESTITRVATACTFQNLHGVFAIAAVVRAKRASRKR
jgi:hypothetical protein